MRAGLVAAVLAFAATWAAAAQEGDGPRALVDAAREGDHETALALVAHGADVDVAAADGTTALHWAGLHGDAAQVEALIDAGANVDARNDYHVTPLAAAAEVADSDVVRALLEAGADPDAPNGDGQTALMVVARAGGLEAAELLIKAGADMDARERWRGQTALMWAGANARAEMIRLLLEHGADPDIRSDPTDFARDVTAEPRAQWRPQGGMTAMLYAARQGCVACVENLIAGGADMDLGDERGVTPLIIALDNLHFDAARALVEAGANPNKWDWWGRTPLYMAVDLNTLPDGGRPDRPSPDAATGLEVARLLLEAGANPNARLKLYPPYRHIVDDRGCDRALDIGSTPLLRAAKVGDAPAVALLLENGADVDLPNVNGLTPLMSAAGLNSIECDIRGGPGYLDPDVQERQLAALELLVDAGGDVNAHEDLPRASYSVFTGRTALHGAAFWGWTDVAAYLVEHGAKIDAVDKQGLSPIDSAMGRAGGHGRGGRIEVYEDTADYLREACARQPDCTPIEASPEG